MTSSRTIQGAKIKGAWIFKTNFSANFQRGLNTVDNVAWYENLLAWGTCSWLSLLHWAMHRPLAECLQFAPTFFQLLSTFCSTRVMFVTAYSFLWLGEILHKMLFFHGGINLALFVMSFLHIPKNALQTSAETTMFSSGFRIVGLVAVIVVLVVLVVLSCCCQLLPC